LKIVGKRVVKTAKGYAELGESFALVEIEGERAVTPVLVSKRLEEVLIGVLTLEALGFEVDLATGSSRRWKRYRCGFQRALETALRRVARHENASRELGCFHPKVPGAPSARSRFYARLKLRPSSRAAKREAACATPARCPSTSEGCSSGKMLDRLHASSFLGTQRVGCGDADRAA